MWILTVCWLMIYWQSVLHSYYGLSCFCLLLLIQGRHHYQLHQLFNKFLLWLCGFLLPWVHVPKAQRGSRQSCKRRYDCLLLIMQSFLNCLILSLKCHKTDGKAIRLLILVNLQHPFLFYLLFYFYFIFARRGNSLSTTFCFALLFTFALFFMVFVLF